MRLGRTGGARNTLEYDKHYLLIPNFQIANVKKYLIDQLQKKRKVCS